MTSMYFQLCDENDRLRKSIAEQSKVLVDTKKENTELKKILKEIVGDYNAAYSIGLISHPIYSIKKAKQLLEKMEVK